MSLRKTSEKEHFSFLISSAGFYASFDPSSAGLRQIATRHDARAKTASESIGSTIIALTDRNDLNQMEDLRKKRLVTRDIDSLSGWLGAKGKLADRIGAKEDQPHLFSTKYSYPDVYSYLLSRRSGRRSHSDVRTRKHLERSPLQGH